LRGGDEMKERKKLQGKRGMMIAENKAGYCQLGQTHQVAVLLHNPISNKLYFG
jgi:hypothetical protein